LFLHGSTINVGIVQDQDCKISKEIRMELID